jgi:hypothetical protein
MWRIEWLIAAVLSVCIAASVWPTCTEASVGQSRRILDLLHTLLQGVTAIYTSLLHTVAFSIAVSTGLQRRTFPFLNCSLPKLQITPNVQQQFSHWLTDNQLTCLLREREREREIKFRGGQWKALPKRGNIKEKLVFWRFPGIAR